MWDYYDIASKLPMKLTLEEFAQLESKPESIIWSFLDFRDVSLYDFGLKISKISDKPEAVREKVREIGENFDLIMIVEHFHESMVLLQDLLCWQFEDLASLKLNVHDPKYRSKISPSGKEKLKEWLKYDYVLYDHFYGKFMEKIRDFGVEKMAQNLEKFKNVNERAQQNCPIKYIPVGKLPRNKRPWGKGVLAYQMLGTDSECQWLAKSEFDFIDILRNLQNERAVNASLSYLNSR